MQSLFSLEPSSTLPRLMQSDLSSMLGAFGSAEAGDLIKAIEHLDFSAQLLPYLPSSLPGQNCTFWMVGGGDANDTLTPVQHPSFVEPYEFFKYESDKTASMWRWKLKGKHLHTKANMQQLLSGSTSVTAICTITEAGVPTSISQQVPQK